MLLASCYHSLEVGVRPTAQTPAVRKVAEQACLLWVLDGPLDPLPKSSVI